jgi:hypothetical protein
VFWSQYYIHHHPALLRLETLAEHGQNRTPQAMYLDPDEIALIHIEGIEDADVFAIVEIASQTAAMAEKKHSFRLLLFLTSSS